ncbi:serine/threonine-protein kinase [Frigoriglobus tundricola]|uniref:Serine/threonine protein kinase n=1 Tax=Frigoriglobus tundricola TaxID=2774151 RepID=A0A6M5YXH1_9BACT|nr:serine/threonine-protein kinase [Frigoriglobus tundricola]QJW98608.1 Serine/threonine protein kinase [Frigoriglobus tundricola]
MAAHDPTHSAPPVGRAALAPHEPASPGGPALTHSDADATVTAPAPAPAPGPRPSAAGRYVLGEEIARGGMGAVYRATDAAFGREVAVKVLLDRFAPTSGTARRFADEARITGQLQHPNVPAVFDLGTLPDGRPFLAMKLIKGDTLEHRLRSRPDPTHDRGRFVAAFERVCQAVAYAHAHHVIHRDLKPSNVMVGSYGEVQVMDWGLAKVLAGGRSDPGDDPGATAGGTEIQSLRDTDDPLTQAGAVLGTPAYMPPEQALGAVHEVDRRSDVFGLGGILAAVLTGRPRSSRTVPSGPG